MTQTFAETRDQLVTDFKAVIEDAEELLKATPGAVGERASAARARVEEKIRAARNRIADLDVVDHAKESARAVDDFVHEHPWGAVGVAALVGLVVGVVVSRR